MTSSTTQQARLSLESLGFLVSDVAPSSHRQRATLRATCGDSEYVIDTSQTVPDGAWLASHEAVDGSGHRAIDRELRPVFSELFRNAERRLVCGSGVHGEAPRVRAPIRVAWFTGDEYALDCLEACLLGTRHVELPGATLDCYGFASPEFALYTDLDAVVLANESGIQLLVNPYSLAFERVRASGLYAELSACGAVVDPDVEVASGYALMIGTDFVGRRDGHAEWAYLHDKYAQLAVAS